MWDVQIRLPCPPEQLYVEQYLCEPIHVAVHQSYLDALKILLDNDADMNSGSESQCPTNHGSSPDGTALEIARRCATSAPLAYALLQRRGTEKLTMVASAVPADSPTDAPTEDKKAHQGLRTHKTDRSDKKKILSRALQKADIAIRLDASRNFDGALEAYGDTCRLLLQVIDRVSGPEDWRKLDSTRATYTKRIEEVRELEAPQLKLPEEKDPEAAPMSDESLPLSPASAVNLTIDANLKDSVSEETPLRR